MMLVTVCWLGLGVIDNSQIITYIISNIIDNLWSVISWNRGESVALMKEAKLLEILSALRGLLLSLRICLDVMTMMVDVKVCVTSGLTAG